MKYRGFEKPGMLSIMPNRPVGDKWEYPREMILNGSCHSFFLFQGKEPVCQKWNGEFRLEYSNRNKWTTSRAGDPEHSVRKRPKRTFPFECQPKFRNLWHNGKHPVVVLVRILESDWLPHRFLFNNQIMNSIERNRERMI